MGARRKSDLDRRLDAYFANLRSSALRRALKRRIGNWQLYAAVSGSAMAMATGASASIIASSVREAPEPAGSVRLAKQPGASSKAPPFIRDIWFAMARRGQSISNITPAVLNPAAQTQQPSINPPGVLPIYGVSNIIQPGELISIYGNNLANETASSSALPTTLGGTNVTINGKLAYLLYVSPTQINLQAPDDTTTGVVPVVVTSPTGTATGTVILSEFAPAFSLQFKECISGIILRTDGTGAFGGGTYDVLGPTGHMFGYPTVAAVPGDIVELFAVGFGPTNPSVPAGQTFSGKAPITSNLVLSINDVIVQPTFVGLTSAGMYQINLVVPTGLGEGEVPIQVTVGGMKTQPEARFVLAFTGGGTSGGGTVIGTGGGGIGTPGGPGTGFGGTGGGTGGGVGGGSGGGTGGGSGGGSGGYAALPKKLYQPRLRFGPDTENA